MANRHRGEIEARLDGKSYKLCLTLGALADLEAAYGAEDMVALVDRFEAGRVSARDCQRIIGAGLRGAGHDIADEGVALMRADGGAAGFVAIVAALLQATFGGTTGGTAVAPAGGAVGAGTGEGRERVPFPGPR